MIERYLYDCLISFIGAWFLFIFSLSLWYWISGLCNYMYIKKRNRYSDKDAIFQPFNELKWKYWYR